MPRPTLAHRMAAAEPYLLLLIWPAMLFPTPGRMLAALLIPVIWLSARLATGRWVPATPLNVPVCVMLCMAAVSMVVTPDQLNSLGKVAGLVYGIALYWALVRWTDDVRRIRLLASGYLWVGGGLAMLGLVGTDWMEKFQPLDAASALLPKLIRGLPGAESGFNPNALAGCLLLFVPVQAAAVWINLRRPPASAGGWPQGRLTRGAQIVLLLLTAGVLVLTQSRAAWISLAAAFCAFLAWRSRFTRRIMVGIGLAAAIALVWIGPARAWAALETQGGPRITFNVESRLLLWRRAADEIRRAPLEGIGMNSFRKLAPYPIRIGRYGSDVAHAHNHLLQATLDLGVPGLLAYLAIWLLAARLLHQMARHVRDSMGRALARGLGLGLFAHFCFGMVDTIPLGAKVGVVFWLTLATVVALHTRWRAGDFS